MTDAWVLPKPTAKFSCLSLRLRQELLEINRQIYINIQILHKTSKLVYFRRLTDKKICKRDKSCVIKLGLDAFGDKLSA